MKIQKVENFIWTRKDERFSEFDIDLNKIVITFDVDPKEKFKLYIEYVMLLNEQGVQLKYNDGTNRKTLNGIINMPVLHVNFEMDECQLLDGALFEIVLRDPITWNYEKHIFVLTEDKWIERSPEY